MVTEVWKEDLSQSLSCTFLMTRVENVFLFYILKLEESGDGAMRLEEGG